MAVTDKRIKREYAIIRLVHLYAKNQPKLCKDMILCNKTENIGDIKEILIIAKIYSL